MPPIPPISQACSPAWLAGGPSIAQLGLLVLVATPVIRVGVSLIAFVVERDRLYVAITAAVLGLLLLSLFLVR